MSDKPWEHEPDHVMFMSEAGYVCEIKRHPRFGHLNGYIYIPKGHPYFGKTYQEFDDEAPRVHGGWTYSDTKGDDDGALYTVFGFDCNHIDDYAPKHVQLLKDANVDHERLYKVEDYKTIEFVTAQLEQAAHKFKEKEKL